MHSLSRQSNNNWTLKRNRSNYYSLLWLKILQMRHKTRTRRLKERVYIIIASLIRARESWRAKIVVRTRRRTRESYIRTTRTLMPIINQRTALLRTRSFDANERRKPARNSSYFRSTTSQTRKPRRVQMIITLLITMKTIYLARRKTWIITIFIWIRIDY